MQAYSNPKRESDPYALPDIEVFQLTAEELAERDEDTMRDAIKRFPLATMNSRERDKAIAWAIEEHGIEGGWCYWYCFPGCMPESDPIGPFKTAADALDDARDNAGNDDDDEADNA